MSPEAPTLAVVIPVFNGADSLRACVASVRAAAGTDPVPEIVVSDDGSTEDMSSVFTELADEGVTVVRDATNRGPAAARNRGAAATAADWLVFLDSDDELAPGSIAALRPSLEPGVGLVRAAYANRSSPTEPGTRAFLAGTFAVRHRVFDTAGGYDEELRFSENSELLMRLGPALDSLDLQSRDDDLILTLVRSVGQSRNYDAARMRAAIHILDQHADHFAADPHERATYEAIASVNASRTRQWSTARRYAWRAVRSEPGNPRSYARFGLSLLGPLGARRTS